MKNICAMLVTLSMLLLLTAACEKQESLKDIRLIDYKPTPMLTVKETKVSLPRLSIMGAKLDPAQSRVSNNHVGGRALRPVPVAAPDAPPAPNGGVPLMDLRDHHCRAISGRGADGLATFCGADKASGAYCAAHARMFYVSVSARAEAA